MLNALAGTYFIRTSKRQITIDECIGETSQHFQVPTCNFIHVMHVKQNHYAIGANYYAYEAKLNAREGGNYSDVLPLKAA